MDEEVQTYSLKLYKKNGQTVTLKEGLTLEEAQAYCRDPQGDSGKCSEVVDLILASLGLTDKWFIGYSAE